ncbi:MAG: hypothetical protein HC774_04705 [Sphingomonadales bacterium]|nr:hypothetical protein [Sphingomonadales bacterium]
MTTGETSGLKIGLAASGGGHVRQLLDIESASAGHDCFYITESTALGQSLGGGRRTHFVDHVALGQARLAGPLRMLAAAWRNAMQSWRIIRRERPDVVISTGAGSMAWAMLIARAHGARIMVIDSFARFDGPSAFARLIGPLAHARIAQSAGAAGGRKHIPVFDPFRILDTPVPAKRDLMFVTVGATLPFDRLVGYAADAARRGLLPAETLIQTGTGGAPVPATDRVTAVETMPFDAVKAVLRDARIVACHAGTGSIITALQAGCHVITVPRRMDLGEHYDDHQAEIATTMAARGLVQMVDSQAAFDAAIAATAQRTPVVATTDPAALIAHIRDWLAEIAATRR